MRFAPNPLHLGQATILPGTDTPHRMKTFAGTHAESEASREISFEDAIQTIREVIPASARARWMDDSETWVGRTGYRTDKSKLFAPENGHPGPGNANPDTVPQKEWNPPREIMSSAAPFLSVIGGKMPSGDSKAQVALRSAMLQFMQTQSQVKTGLSPENLAAYDEMLGRVRDGRSDISLEGEGADRTINFSEPNQTSAMCFGKENYRCHGQHRLDMPDPAAPPSASASHKIAL